MIFSSYKFIFIFAPVVVLGYHLLRKTKNELLVKLWLLIASLAFYAVGQLNFLLGLIATLIVNYLVILGLNKAKAGALRKLLISADCIWNIGLLFYFKYTNFFIENINIVFGKDIPFIKVILPLGISFFTFQILAYVVAFYNEEFEKDSFIDYAVFVTFFPQLIVGPVVNRDEVIPQITDKKLLAFDRDNIYKGIMLFSFGCAKKIILANPMINYASMFYGGQIEAFNSVQALAGVLCYTLAYYFDFSGYIDMARGLGHFFGISLPINFDSPYKADNFGDFWRKWNMTISRFFNEHIFNNVFHFGDGFLKMFFAVLATFFVSGLWHGAGWHYILWGVANGVLVCIANYRALKNKKPLPKAIGVFFTFVIGMLVRVLFDSSSLSQAKAVYIKLFDIRHLRTFCTLVPGFISANKLLCLVMLVSLVIVFAFDNTNSISEKKEFTAKDAVLSGLLLGASLLFMGSVSTFLYFNF